MATKETHRERQENELEALKSIFGDAVTDLRPKQEKWFPLDIKIYLTPQQDSATTEVYSSVFLRILAQRNYPKVSPKLSLENPKNLKDADISTFISQLNKEAYALRGQEVIFDLCQSVQAFLRERNKPPMGSFYDAMVANKQKRVEDEFNEQKDKADRESKALHEEVMKRKEQLKKESRVRRSTMSESSPMRHVSISSDNDSRNFEQVCDEHQRSESLYFPLAGRKILKGACLGHSLKGCVTYSGIDATTGQLVYLTEWIVKYAQIESKNLKVDDVIDNLERMVTVLAKIKHKRLINYECVMVTKRKEHLTVFLVQEFLHGISVSISSGLGWSPEGVSMIAKAVLECLDFLHKGGHRHGNLMDSTVFIDSTGCIRVTDYEIVPYLQELNGATAVNVDLRSLGTLIESLIPTPHLEMRDFINQCKSERTLLASDLLEHPFLSPLEAHSQTPEVCRKASNGHIDRPIVNLPVVPSTPAPFEATSNYSRVNEEFTVQSDLGSGAYGDVQKVHNSLDNRMYALKRIPLSSRNKQLFKKMTREVELLSRLNHENVVRYYNSWIETRMENVKKAEKVEDSNEKSEAFITTHSKKRLLAPIEDSDDSDTSSSGWNNFIGNAAGNDESDDGIMFADSQGNAAQYESVDYEMSAVMKKDKAAGGDAGAEVTKRKVTTLYIQMEYCEKSTLRSAIDQDKLFKNKERVWRLFREIVEGLSHIHQQGMIHRDLKPVNIFLDSKDQVKIGDFGLATTSILALQQNVDPNQSQLPNYGDSATGLVGTALYCSPELSGAASKATYNQKVDIYSLGIIFFEMCNAPLTTNMERIKTLAALRTPEIMLPKEMLEDETCKNEVKLLRWLLDHDPANRPTSEELLQSELLPPAKVEATELEEMLRDVLSNPQNRSYKYLISRCLTQESDVAGELAYHAEMVPVSTLFEHVKTTIVNVVKKHGGIDVSTPLLTVFNKSNTCESAVKLMTHSGLVVSLPTELRHPFLRYVAINGFMQCRRYTIGRVYREKKVFNFHPKQSLELAFDIVTYYRGHFLVDAELLKVVHEMICELGLQHARSFAFRINHTSLLRAIFMYYSVPKEKYKSLLLLVRDYVEQQIQRFQFIASVTSLLHSKVHVVTGLVEALLVSDISVNTIASSPLKVLIKGRGDATSLAKGALRELEAVSNLAQAMGVNIPINLCVGLVSNWDFNSNAGSITWQLIGEIKSGRISTFATGGRYDSTIEEYQKIAKIQNHEIYCAGFSLNIDKIVLCLSTSLEIKLTVVDLIVYVIGQRPPLKEVTSVLRSLWSAGIKCCFIESQNEPEDFDVKAKELGANHIIMLGEDGHLRIKSWQNDNFDERVVTRKEVIEYLKKHLNADVSAITEQMQAVTLARNNSYTNVKEKFYEAPTISQPSIEIIFITAEKLVPNKKRRLENQIEQKFNNLVDKFNSKQRFVVFAVELEAKLVKSFIGCIDPHHKDPISDWDVVSEKLPKHKHKYMQEIVDVVQENLMKNKNSYIFGLFSIQDAYHRLIL